MKPVVYVDILFLLNFFVNTVIIYISFMVSKQKLKLWRLILSAVFLSLYACLMFFPKIQIFYSILGKVLALSISSVIAFPTRIVVNLFKNTIILFASYAIMGGVVFALIFTTNFGTSPGSMVSNGEFYINIKASTLIISIMLAYVCVYIIAEFKKTAQINSGQILNIKISFMGKEIHIKGFLDTGCSLRDPQSGFPVIIISPFVAKKLLPKPLYLFFANNNQSNIPVEFLNIYRIIPYSTIDNKKGFLHGILPDSIEIQGSTIKKCVIAVSKQNLSSNKYFDAIFGTEIFEETKIHERTSEI